MAKTYSGEPRYVLETTHGCYSDYGWTIACSGDDLAEMQHQYNHWSKTGQYRLVDNSDGTVILGE